MGVWLGLHQICFVCSQRCAPTAYPISLDSRLSIETALPESHAFLPLLKEALAGIIVAHICHLLSVFILFALTLNVLPTTLPRREKTAFLAAILHIFSPAGVFLSAPYSEGLFSCLNFLGMLLYAQTHTPRSSGQSRTFTNAALIGSGLCWGLASSVRGNGILSGLILLYRCVTLLDSLPSFTAVQDLVVTVLAGILVAIGTIVPQWIAFEEYCLGAASGSELPTWCSAIPPSIFKWVQSHYWYVSFVKDYHAMLTSAGTMVSCDTGLYQTLHCSPLQYQ